MIWHLALVFVCGALYEASCVGFVALNGRGRTVAFSMLTGAAEATGILDCVGHLERATALVLGFGAGTFVAMTLKQRDSSGR